jgi:hypothetical protein
MPIQAIAAFVIMPLQNAKCIDPAVVLLQCLEMLVLEKESFVLTITQDSK